MAFPTLPADLCSPPGALHALFLGLLILFTPASAIGQSVAPRLEEGSTRIQRSGLDAPGHGGLETLPALQWSKASRVSAQWDALKEEPRLDKQLRQLKRMRLRHYVATDLKRLTTLGSDFSRVFQRRDHYRDRLHASPEMYALLSRASELLSERLPHPRITVGDIAQAGGGQIAHGVRQTIVRDNSLTTPAQDLARGAHPQFGALIRREVVDPLTAFPSEFRRFEEFESPLLVETTITSSHFESPRDIQARVETRRFWLDDPEEEVSGSRWWSQLQKRLKSWKRISQERDTSGKETLWRTRYLRRRQFVEVVSRKKPSKRLAADAIVEVRTASLNPKKPGVRLNERLYQPIVGWDGSLDVLCWRLLYEASHISHKGGLDADLSYILTDVGHHFSRRVHLIDREATRTWLKTLADAAMETGVTIEKILVDPRVKRHLQRGMTTKERSKPWWKLLGVANGHDSHLHIRLAPGFTSNVAECAGSGCDPQENATP